MSEKRVYLLMVFTALFWSGAFITGKIATREFPAFALTFYRFLFAVPFIFTILYMREPDNILPGRRQWLPLAVLGVLGTFCYHALFFTSLKYTTAINASLIGAMNPMVTTLLAAVFFHEHLTPMRIAGIVLSFSGVFLVVTNFDIQVIRQFHINPGDLYMLAAVCSWAAYSLLSRQYMKKFQLSPLMVTAYTFLICVIVSIPFVLWENPSAYMAAVTWSGWLSVLYMSIFASVLGYLFQLVAIQRIGASRSAVFVNLVPIFTIVQSVIILGEAVSIFKLIGAVTIIGGVYLTVRSASDCTVTHSQAVKAGLYKENT